MENIIYIRTSTEEQTPEHQLKDCEELIEGQEYIMFKEKESAFRKDYKREQFNIILNLIKKKQVNVIVVWDLDRIYRNRLKLIEFFTLCKHYKVKVLSYRQKWLNDISLIPQPFNEIVFDLMLNIFGWIGEEESLKKSERVKKAFTKKKGVTIAKASGKRVGRKALPKQTKDKIINLHKQGLSIRVIMKQVYTTDKNKNMKPISKSVVHKTIQEYNAINSS